ncbi:MAG: transposase, OrfB family [Firmicutes bacterium]|nr:transposase, OrfB family [Bacillota bacterium]
MLRAYKTELNLTPEQKHKINQTIGICRYIYNFYLAHNKEVYEQEKRFVSGMDFSKWLNNEYLPNNPEFAWIKSVSSKAVKQAIMNGEKAFKRFFKGESKFPNFKKKKRQDVKAYFPKNNKTDWTVERHRINIPTIGVIQLKEKGYIPTEALVKSGTISMQAGKYFVSVLVEVSDVCQNNMPKTKGIGIDLGIKDLAIVSNEKTFKNINKSSKVKHLVRKLEREQRRLSKKYENKKKRGEQSATYSANITKQVKKVQSIHMKLTNIRKDYTNKVVNEIVKPKPSHVTIEDLNVSGMMKNRHLSKVIAQQNFYYFRTKLEYKCRLNGIELRMVDRFYPSSKICSCCGNSKKDLKLSDRTYVCKECGLVIDRDLNASINLANAEIYKIA